MPLCVNDHPALGLCLSNLLSKMPGLINISVVLPMLCSKQRRVPLVFVLIIRNVVFPIPGCKRITYSGFQQLLKNTFSIIAVTHDNNARALGGTQDSVRYMLALSSKFICYFHGNPGSFSKHH